MNAQYLEMIANIDEENMSPILSRNGELFNREKRLKNLHKINQSNAFISVVLQKEKVVAYSIVEEEADKVLKIASLQISSGLKGLSRGKALLQLFKKLMYSLNDFTGEYTMVAEAHTDNFNSIELQRKLGFSCSQGSRPERVMHTCSLSTIRTKIHLY